jgi:hypothetical protein
MSTTRRNSKVICRQMLRSVRVTRVGDTDFLVDEQVDRFRVDLHPTGGWLVHRSGESSCVASLANDVAINRKSP